MSTNDRRTELEERARDIAKLVDGELPEKTGFALLIFDFDPGHELTWISNARREDMVKTLRELLERFEGGGADHRSLS